MPYLFNFDYGFGMNLLGMQFLQNCNKFVSRKSSELSK